MAIGHRTQRGSDAVVGDTGWDRDGQRHHGSRSSVGELIDEPHPALRRGQRDRVGSTRNRDGVERVAVTSGASVPESLVQGVLAYLAERGYPDARAVTTAEESLIFALPPELRRDIRQAAQAQGGA